MKFFNFFEAPLPEYIDKDKVDNFRSYASLTKEFDTKTRERIKKLIEKITSKTSEISKPKTLEFLRNLFSKKKAHLGKGSARAVYYGNGGTVIKVAINPKGLAQNKVEMEKLEMLEDDLSDEQIRHIARLVDYDRSDRDEPVWLETKRAQKITKKQFENYFKIKFDKFASFIRETSSGRKHSDEFRAFADTERGGPIIDLMETLKWNYDMGINDFTVLGNWGMINGIPALVDLGFDSTVFKKHYMRR